MSSYRSRVIEHLHAVRKSVQDEVMLDVDDHYIRVQVLGRLREIVDDVAVLPTPEIGPSLEDG